MIRAQEQSVFEVTQLTESIYKLTADGGGYAVKVLASVGEDGLLLVETGQKETAEDLEKAIENFGKGLPKIIISSHEHVEHIGGNIILGKSAVIIGHKNLRPRLMSGSYLFDEFPDDILPDIMFTDSMTIHFNGEEIKLIAFPGSHSDNDIIIWFTRSRVVFVGALSNGSHFPSVDEASGNVLLYPEIVRQVIDLLPDDVTIIPGHGEDGNMEAYRIFYDMLVGTRDVVRSEMDKGKDLATLQEEDVLSQWTSFEGSYVDKNQWIKYLFDAFDRKKSGAIARKSIYEPMYYTLKEKDVEAAIDQYFELKKNNADEYEFLEEELVFIAYKLFKNDRISEAVRFFELGTKEYPEGSYRELSFYYIGKGYFELGNRAAAIENLNEALRINPENTRAAELLKEITG
jgi:glyoxylase-like metal-dependent hydrolase (beta-lactamase superfamily II)